MQEVYILPVYNFFPFLNQNALLIKNSKTPLSHTILKKGCSETKFFSLISNTCPLDLENLYLEE